MLRGYQRHVELESLEKGFAETLGISQFCHMLKIEPYRPILIHAPHSNWTMRSFAVRREPSG